MHLHDKLFKFLIKITTLAGIETERARFTSKTLLYSQRKYQICINHSKSFGKLKSLNHVFLKL